MRKLFILVCVCFLVSCTSNTVYKKPDNLIPKDSMILLLTEMYIASTSKYKKNKFQEKDVNYMYFVYKKFKIDSLRFAKSNTFYTSRIDEYGELLTEVKKNLTDTGKVIQIEINKLDSIKKGNVVKQKLPLPKDSMFKKARGIPTNGKVKPKEKEEE